MHITLAEILINTREWFEKAVPNPTDTNVNVQLGCHMEEVGEMLAEVRANDLVTAAALQSAVQSIDNLATVLKTGGSIRVDLEGREPILDAICDQIVTGIGVGHMLGLDTVCALREVNRSNHSKFVDGQPIFNENGKIMKGPDYSEPVLTDYT